MLKRRYTETELLHVWLHWAHRAKPRSGFVLGSQWVRPAPASITSSSNDRRSSVASQETMIMWRLACLLGCFGFPCGKSVISIKGTLAFSRLRNSGAYSETKQQPGRWLPALIGGMLGASSASRSSRKLRTAFAGDWNGCERESRERRFRGDIAYCGSPQQFSKNVHNQWTILYKLLLSQRYFFITD